MRTRIIVITIGSTGGDTLAVGGYILLGRSTGWAHLPHRTWMASHADHHHGNEMDQRDTRWDGWLLMVEVVMMDWVIIEHDSQATCEIQGKRSSVLSHIPYILFTQSQIISLLIINTLNVEFSHFNELSHRSHTIPLGSG